MSTMTDRSGHVSGAVVRHQAPALSARGHTRRHEMGRTLYLTGDRADSLFRVVEGVVRVARMTPDGGVVTVRHVIPGDFFGEAALLGSEHTTTAEAMTDVEIEAIDMSFIGVSGLELVTKSLAQQMQRLMDYGYHLQSGDLHQRVARYLAFLADTPVGVLDAAGHTSVNVTHELIAEGTGSTRESVSKIITELRSEDLIASGYRSIVLVDLDRLQVVANGC